jgi:guanosine-3',5'-bis(diphosphate) 3'-pyrophosphohydrolase
MKRSGQTRNTLVAERRKTARRKSRTLDAEAAAVLFHALAFAAHKHRDQRRKGTDRSPYINHPIALANVLCTEAGIGDVAVLCAAVLHDTVEDTDTTPEELQSHFGKEVREIVMEVTDDKRLPPGERKRLQVEHASRASAKAKMVKLADKICNLRDVVKSPPASWDLRRRQAYFDWAKQVIDQQRGVHAGLEALFDAAYANRPET